MPCGRTRVWFLASCLLAGCTGSIDDLGSPGDEGGLDPGGGGDSSTPREGKISTNGLALDPGLVAGLPIEALGRWRAEGQAELDLDDLGIAVADRAAALDHLDYLTTCALDPGEQLIVRDGGTEHRFDGLYGLGRAWIADRCDESCQRWLSACLVAHANYWGVSVAVSLRGEHPGLGWDPAIVADFPVQEGAFFGNLFAAATAPGTFACIGQELLDRPDQSAYFEERLCVAGGVCGLQLVGVCFDSAEPIGSSCEVDGGVDGFRRCHDAATQIETATVFPESITVYLEELAP